MGWGRVYGGAEGGSGWKPEKPKPTERWECECFDHAKRGLNRRRSNPPYLKNCPDCWARRPY